SWLARAAAVVAGFRGVSCSRTGSGFRAAAQSSGQVFNPQKFAGWSSVAPTRQPRPLDPIGWQSTTYPVVLRPSLLWNCTGMPASNRAGERKAQPCALTTSVSQTSEKCASGLRLVTSTRADIGTLELRREVMGIAGLCIIFLGG